MDDGNKDDGVLSTDEHTITIDLEVTQCTPAFQIPSYNELNSATYEYKINESAELVIDFEVLNGDCLF